jgi:3D (Asp-Asp-Asp) domain-containing protein
LEKRRGKSSDRIALKLVVAVCVLSCIAGVAYTKADRTAILLSATVPQAEAGRVGLAPPVSSRVVEPNQPANHHPQAALEDATHHEQAGPPPRLASGDAGAGEWRTVRMRVTGYCPCAKCCGQYADGITATGHKIQPGDAFVAADKRYSFGTEMIIPGYNNDQPVKVLDRGGAIRGNKLDAFFHTHQEALQWGVKYLDIKVRVN